MKSDRVEGGTGTTTGNGSSDAPPSNGDIHIDVDASDDASFHSAESGNSSPSQLRRAGGAGPGGSEYDDGNVSANETLTIDPTQPTPKRSNVGYDRSAANTRSGSGGSGNGSIGSIGADGTRKIRLPSAARRSPMKGTASGDSSPMGRNISEDYDRMDGNGNVDGDDGRKLSSRTGHDDDPRHPELPNLHGDKASSKISSHHHHHHHRHHRRHKKHRNHDVKTEDGDENNKDGDDDDEEEEEEREDEMTIAALHYLLSTYNPEDLLDDDEVLRMSQKAHAAYKNAMERRRERLIFGPDDSSSDEALTDGEGSSKSSLSGKGLGLLLAEVAEDVDPEEAMWNYGNVEERFFDSIVVAAAVRESGRRLRAAASATNSEGSKNATATTDSADRDEETPHGPDDGDDQDATSSKSVAETASASNSALSPSRPSITNNRHGSTPISIKAASASKNVLSKAASSTTEKAPRVVMDDPTLDELRKALGLRESEFVFSSTGRRRKHHYIRPRRRHRHHYAHVHKHGHADTDDDHDGHGNGDGDDTENEGVQRALGKHSKPRPTRVTRRLTKAHREKKKEERHARQLRGLEALVEEAMDLEININGMSMSTADALVNVDVATSSDEDGYDADRRRGTSSGRKRAYSTDGNGSSSEESFARGVSSKRIRPAYDQTSGRKPGKDELVPLYAMVPAAEYGRVRRRAGRLVAEVSGMRSSNVADYDSDGIWDGGTAFRPVTVTRIIVNEKPVILARLTKQISDAAKARLIREKQFRERMRAEEKGEAKKKRQQRREERIERERARASKRQRLEISPLHEIYDHNDGVPMDGRYVEIEYEEEEEEENVFDEDGPIISEVVGDFRLPDDPGRVFSHPVSLTLLDWRRRQQWLTSDEMQGGGRSEPRMRQILPGVTADLDCEAELAAFPSAYRNGRKRPVAEVASAGLDSANQPWQTVLPGADISRQQPATVESPRRRHTDETYAKWCADLIHCLSGSGRSMARHEFFYSDLDRAWFNFDSYGADVANLGVPHGVRLSRSEWSLVRRAIKSRPRRFSRRFAKSQMTELKEYRKKARKIQLGDDTEKENFGFEVPAPIRVGMMVSALSKRARIVHRGVVLNRHPGSNGYLIQFERKELGYEFVPDTEVASHGVPDVILPPAEAALDGSYIGSFSRSNWRELGSLPNGTTYGPLSDDKKGWDYQALSLLQKQPESMIVRSFILRALQKPTSALLNAGKIHENNEVTGKIAEREALVKTMGAMHNLKVRKSVILDAIELCNKRWRSTHESGRVNNEAASALKSHYAWLRANLVLTNQAINTAVVHFRALYGNAYSGCDSSIRADEEKIRINSIEASLKDAAMTPRWKKGMWDNWVVTAVEGSKSIGGEIVSTVLENENATDRHLDDGNAQARLDFMESRLSSAASLLQVIKICSDGYSPSSSENAAATTPDTKPIDAGAVGKSLQEALRNLRPTFVRQASSICAEADLAREQSFKDLAKAVAMLQSEFAEICTE